jgi:hypothetical protein
MFLENSLKVRDLFAIYKGTAIIVNWINFEKNLGIHSHLMKRYTILVERAIHVIDIII